MFGCYTRCVRSERAVYVPADALSLLLQKRALTMKVLHKENLPIFQALGWLRGINCKTIECRRWEKITCTPQKALWLNNKEKGIKTRPGWLGISSLISYFLFHNYAPGAGGITSKILNPSFYAYFPSFEQV